MGPALLHVATIDMEVAGQAFTWAQDGSRRVFAIDRRRLAVRAIDVPAVAIAERDVARRFR